MISAVPCHTLVCPCLRPSALSLSLFTLPYASLPLLKFQRFLALPCPLPSASAPHIQPFLDLFSVSMQGECTVFNKICMSGDAHYDDSKAIDCMVVLVSGKHTSSRFCPMRSQRQLPHQIPRLVPRRPLMPFSHGHHVFCSTVFCLHVRRHIYRHIIWKSAATCCAILAP